MLFYFVDTSVVVYSQIRFHFILYTLQMLFHFMNTSAVILLTHQLLFQLIHKTDFVLFHTHNRFDFILLTHQTLFYFVLFRYQACATTYTNTAAHLFRNSLMLHFHSLFSFLLFIKHVDSVYYRSTVYRNGLNIYYTVQDTVRQFNST